MPAVQKPQSLQEKLRKLQAEHKKLLAIFYRNDELIAGSYGEVFMRCGRPTCRCHDEGGHFATRLARWVDGKLKTKIVRVNDRRWVKHASDRYKAHKSALQQIRKLHSEEITLLKRITGLKTIEYE